MNEGLTFYSLRCRSHILSTPERTGAIFPYQEAPFKIVSKVKAFGMRNSLYVFFFPYAFFYISLIVILKSKADLCGCLPFCRRNTDLPGGIMLTCIFKRKKLEMP